MKYQSIKGYNVKKAITYDSLIQHCKIDKHNSEYA